MEAAVWIELIKASPYLGFVILFMWFQGKQEDKRTENAAALETRREAHEKAMQERLLQHDRDINTLWAGYIQQIVDEIKVSNKVIVDKLEEHEEESEKRYAKLGNTKELLKAIQEKR